MALKMNILVNASIEQAPESALPIPTAGCFYYHLLYCLGYGQNDYPVADLLRQLQGLEGEWLVASPIHWQATHNDAMILACGDALSLSECEAKQWFAAFKDFVSSEGFQVHYHNPYTWLIRCDEKPKIRAQPVYNLQHKSMMQALKNLDETLYWQRFITENQMFFSTHALNKARTHNEINGVWLWGSGQLHSCSSTPLICASEDLVPLAQLLSRDIRVSTTTAHSNSLLLFNELSVGDRLILEKRYQKQLTHWYWNNLSYTTPKAKTWFSRLMGK